jgi:hypothetical protein
MSELRVYKGFLKKGYYAEESDILFLDDESEPLGQSLQDDRELYGPFATVRYYVADKEMSKESLDENLIRQYSGDTEANFGAAYSEYTGYLWTNEEFKIVGHDLLEELHESIGKYLYLEIEWNKENPDLIKE